MSPTAKAELRAYTKRLNKSRPIFLRKFDTGFALGIALGIVAVLLAWALWFVTKH